MSSVEETKYLRLIKFSDISLKVSHAYAESNILHKYNNSFTTFLTKNKHHLYHLYFTNFCCQCGPAGFVFNKKLFKEQFNTLYSMTGVTNPSHVKKVNKNNTTIVRQHCICNVVANPTCSLEDLDISLLHTLIITCEPNLNSDDTTWFDTLKDVRNNLAHPKSFEKLVSSKLDKLWSELETSVIGLASKSPPKHYKEAIQGQISLLKVAELNSGDKEELLNLIKAENEKINKELSEKVDNCVQKDELKLFENKVIQSFVGEIGVKLTTHFSNLISEFQKPHSSASEQNGKRKIDIGCQVEGDMIDSDVALKVLSNKEKAFNDEGETKAENADKFDIMSANKGSLLLDLSATPEVLRSEQALKFAIRDLVERILKAGNVDTTVPGTLNITLNFKSPLTAEELRVVQAVCSANPANKQSVETDESSEESVESRQQCSYENKIDETNEPPSKIARIEEEIGPIEELRVVHAVCSANPANKRSVETDVSSEESVESRQQCSYENKNDETNEPPSKMLEIEEEVGPIESDYDMEYEVKFVKWIKQKTADIKKIVQIQNEYVNISEREIARIRKRQQQQQPNRDSERDELQKAIEMHKESAKILHIQEKVLSCYEASLEFHERTAKISAESKEWNYGIRKKKSLHGNSGSNKNQKLGLCKLCSVIKENFNENRCHDCCMDMCEDCTTEHRTLYSKQEHNIQPLSDIYLMDYTEDMDDLVIYDLKVLPGGLLVIADEKGQQLITCDLKGKQWNKIQLPSDPWKITVVDKRTVAVILYSEELIIVDTYDQKKLCNVSIKGCSSIAYSINKLFVGCSDYTIKIVSLSGEVTGTKPVGFLPWYICGNEKGQIYCTSYKNELYCLDSDCNRVFTYTTPSMSGSIGMTIDDEGSVLVVCQRSNNVHKISPDGRSSRIVVSHIPSSFHSPYICYHSLSTTLLLAGDNKLYAYKKQYNSQ